MCRADFFSPLISEEFDSCGFKISKFVVPILSALEQIPPCPDD